MQAAILAIGDELLAGRTQDTNSRYLARRLGRLGIPLKEVRMCADDETAIQLGVWELAERRRADLVITSGGLGPTHDDRTVKALANLHGVPLVKHQATYERMEKRAQSLHEQGKRPTPDPGPGAEKVALVPQGATVLTNPAGAAPGLLIQRRLLHRKGTAWTLVLPGVPEELRAIWNRHAEAWIAGQAPDARLRRAVTRRWECHGRESELAPHFAAIEREHPRVQVGSYPGWGTTRIVVSLTGPPAQVEAATATLQRHMDTAKTTIKSLKEDDDETD